MEMIALTEGVAHGPPVGFRLIYGVGVEDTPILHEPIVVLVSGITHEMAFVVDVADCKNYCLGKGKCGIAGVLISCLGDIAYGVVNVYFDCIDLKESV
jgi:hypothetical protein